MARDEDFAGDDGPGIEMEQWWLACPATLLVWARLRVLASGIAQVFDSHGDTLVYESEESARAALMDADFRSLDGIDDEEFARAHGRFQLQAELFLHRREDR